MLALVDPDRASARSPAASPRSSSSNFGNEPVLVPSAAGTVILATHAGDTALEPGGVRVPPRAGVLLRG